MEAPDKLFIKPEKIKVEMIPGGELPNVGIQYIRKDFLLRWAKNELENARITDFDDFGRGEVITWEEIVDKLNSL